MPRRDASIICVVEEASEISPTQLLSGQTPEPEYTARDVSRAIAAAADDKRIKAVVLDLEAFGGGSAVHLSQIGAAMDKVRAAGYTKTDAYSPMPIHGLAEALGFNEHLVPKIVLGASNGWPGEKWLDIRRTDILLPIMHDRMQNWCKDKGFDAIEPDLTIQGLAIMYERAHISR